MKLRRFQPRWGPKPAAGLIEPRVDPEFGRRLSSSDAWGEAERLLLRRIVLADSSEEAVAKAEALSPRQITSRGKCVQTEPGLADPASVEAIERN